LCLCVVGVCLWGVCVCVVCVCVLFLYVCVCVCEGGSVWFWCVLVPTDKFQSHMFL
jgi:hypothetical protein